MSLRKCHTAVLHSFVLICLLPPQSYGPEHLLTFHNLKRIGLLTEQAAGETLTAVESRVSKLVTDRAAGESLHCRNPRAGERIPGDCCAERHTAWPHSWHCYPTSSSGACTTTLSLARVQLLQCIQRL